jgi:hypothetical protein
MQRGRLAGLPGGPRWPSPSGEARRGSPPLRPGEAWPGDSPLPEVTAVALDVRSAAAVLGRAWTSRTRERSVAAACGSRLLSRPAALRACGFGPGMRCSSSRRVCSGSAGVRAGSVLAVVTTRRTGGRTAGRGPTSPSGHGTAELGDVRAAAAACRSRGALRRARGRLDQAARRRIVSVVASTSGTLRPRGPERANVPRPRELRARCCAAAPGG